MMHTTIADRKALKGDKITGMRVTFTDGFEWAGEFHATYGDGKVAAFLAQCDQAKVGAVYLSVSSDPTPTLAMTFAHNAYLDDRR